MENVTNEGIIRFQGMFNQDILLLTNPRALGEMFVHEGYNFEKRPGIRDLLRVILDDGLIVTEGDGHKFQRRHIMPSSTSAASRNCIRFFGRRLLSSRSASPQTWRRKSMRK